LEYEQESFLLDAYDSKPNEEQFSSQRPLGRQSIFQLELMVDDAEMPSLDELSRFLEKTLTKLEYSPLNLETFTNVGDGGLITSVFHQGSVILVWDGSRHVDINLFAFDQRQALADSFLDDFIEFTEGRLKLALRDDQPRGIGRVVSFASEIEQSNIQAARQ
jgi:hypothetical protein